MIIMTEHKLLAGHRYYSVNDPQHRMMRRTIEVQKPVKIVETEKQENVILQIMNRKTSTQYCEY